MYRIFRYRIERIEVIRPKRSLDRRPSSSRTRWEQLFSHFPAPKLSCFTNNVYEMFTEHLYLCLRPIRTIRKPFPRRVPFRAGGVFSGLPPTSRSSRSSSVSEIFSPKNRRPSTSFSGRLGPPVVLSVKYKHPGDV